MGTSLVPTKHLWRPRCFQIIQRWLFLSLYCMKDKRLYCSPTNLKRDLGLYDREQVSVNLLSQSITVIVRSFSLRDYYSQLRNCCILRLKHTKFCLCLKKKKLESIVKSQNIVEQVNSNPNNISLTMSRRHIIYKSSKVAELKLKNFTPKKIRTCVE